MEVKDTKRRRFFVCGNWKMNGDKASIDGIGDHRRVKEERGNVPLIGVSSFKALTCRVSSSQVLTIWPLPLFRLGNSI